MKELTDFIAVQASPMLVVIRPRELTAEAYHRLTQQVNEQRAHVPEWVTILVIADADVFVASEAEIHSGHLSG